MEDATRIHKTGLALQAQGLLISSYVAEGNLTEAYKSCLNELDLLYKQSSPPHHIVRELCYLAIVQESDKKFDQAEATLERANSLAARHECDGAYVAAPLFGVAELSFAKGRQKAAEELWKKGFEILEDNNSEFRSKVGWRNTGTG